MRSKRSDLFAIVGAGPSLDFCRAEIESLAARGAKFLVSDSVAAALLKAFPGIDATVFTVELRRHLYLARISRLAKYTVMAYHRAAARNLRNIEADKFKILGEEGDLPELYSPGTVLGVMLSAAVKMAKEIHIFGADFSYIDNQVYSRFIDPHAPQVNRLSSRERWQYEMALKKSTGVILKNGYAIRTSFELMQARENMRGFLAQLPKEIRIMEYSPIGFDSERVEKRIPKITNI